MNILDKYITQSWTTSMRKKSVILRRSGGTCVRLFFMVTLNAGHRIAKETQRTMEHGLFERASLRDCSSSS